MREQIQLQVHRTWRIEGLRAKLKRLVTRQTLLEPQPGLVTRAPTPDPEPRH